MPLINVNPNLDGPRSPTPARVWEPRLWAGRVWVKGNGRWGTRFAFKAPYGVAMNAATILQRAAMRGQIIKYEIGPMAPEEIPLVRSSLERYEPVFERLSLQLGVDWGA